MQPSLTQQVSCLAIAAALELAALPLGAAICTVPSVGYPTIAASLADPSCDPILVAAGTFAESLSIARDVTLTGAGSGSTTIAGWLAVRGSATDAVVSGLRLDASAAAATLCTASALDVRGGARASGLDVVVVGRKYIGLCRISYDMSSVNFETTTEKGRMHYDKGNSEVVQRIQGLRIHYCRRWHRCFCALLDYLGERFQDLE